ncbi:uncharacterized protein LOC110380410 [Helicoverpa armigera]|uniref:uncharacterized protein LOC110380410 n=1 Tax=Helicoverpa armigera TaxID=29058 RepID=UPI00308276B3
MQVCRKLNLTSRELAQLQYANLTQREYKILQKKTDNKFTTLAPKISAKVLADIRNRTKNFTDLLAIITPDELDALQHAKLTEEEYELLQKRTNGAFTTAVRNQYAY